MARGEWYFRSNLNLASIILFCLANFVLKQHCEMGPRCTNKCHHVVRRSWRTSSTAEQNNSTDLLIDTALIQLTDFRVWVSSVADYAGVRFESNSDGPRFQLRM